ncbi:MAG: alanine racemase [Candidatus Korobacteraceae bacterium]
MRPTWVEISLPALRHNYEAIRQRVGDTVTVCAVLKADAYGHGVVECARALESVGADWIGVTTTEEGVRLREAGVGARILLMTGFWRGDQEEIVRQRLTPAVWDWWQIGALETVLTRGPEAQAPFPVHVKVDTGMARLGVPEIYTGLFLRRLKAAPQIAMEGLFTHLSSADQLQRDTTEQQVARFAEFEKCAGEHGFRPRYVHLANSACVAARPGLWRDMVRPGIALHGYVRPVGHPQLGDLDLKPVLSWKTRIVSLKEVPAGQPVGYHGTYVTKVPSKLAVLPVGYADGLDRRLSNNGQVIVRGHCAPLAGRISMDLALADVTLIEGANVGDEVTLLGSDGKCMISALDHARAAGTITHDILCSIGSRVPRKYVESAGDSERR